VKPTGLESVLNCLARIPERSQLTVSDDAFLGSSDGPRASVVSLPCHSTAKSPRNGDSPPDYALVRVRDLVKEALAEDVGTGDVTSKLTVPKDGQARARVDQKEPGVIAGLEVAEAVFREVDKSLRFMALTSEGQWSDGGPVCAVEGNARSILAGERVALNFLGRLSGVATLTARYVEAIHGTKARILDTRKTTPLMRELEKKAVLIGGGFNHRFGLDDAVLIKENHSKMAGGVGEATKKAIEGAPKGMMIVVECASLQEVDEALDAGATHLLADNMNDDELRATVERSEGRATVEASGGVNLDTVRAIAETGVDYISVGALTHSAKALDLSLLLYY
jgi:nicotinate-nucleotide pyrophosphorylase (carboxylating)